MWSPLRSALLGAALTLRRHAEKHRAARLALKRWRSYKLDGKGRLCVRFGPDGAEIAGSEQQQCEDFDDYQDGFFPIEGGVGELGFDPEMYPDLDPDLVGPLDPRERMPNLSAGRRQEEGHAETEGTDAETPIARAINNRLRELAAGDTSLHRHGVYSSDMPPPADVDTSGRGSPTILTAIADRLASLSLISEAEAARGGGSGRRTRRPPMRNSAEQL